MILIGSYEDNEKTLGVSISVISINEPKSMSNISKNKKWRKHTFRLLSIIANSFRIIWIFIGNFKLKKPKAIVNIKLIYKNKLK